MEFQVITPSPEQRAHDLAIAYVGCVCQPDSPTMPIAGAIPAESMLQKVKINYLNAYNLFLSEFAQK